MVIVAFVLALALGMRFDAPLKLRVQVEDPYAPFRLIPTCAVSPFKPE